MSGAIAAVGGSGILSGGGSGGGDATPAALNWTNAQGDVIAFTNNQTISGINTPISLKVTWTGAGGVAVSQNTGFTSIANGASFIAKNADVIAFGLSNGGLGVATGTVTITNLSDGSTVLDTFTYSVTRIAISI